MNKILAPLNNRLFLDDLINSGVDEFYMGFHDAAWTDCYGEYSEINRMSGFKKAANPYNLEELLDVAKEIKKKSKSIFVTVNSATYTQKELDKLKEYFNVFAKAKIDGVIVSTPELTLLAKECGVEPIASTMCGLFNSELVSFYRSLGMNRMILPRDLSMDEISRIVQKNPDITYEVFLMRNGCQFSDSHCLGFHRNKGSTCSMLNNAQCSINSSFSGFKMRHAIELNHELYGKWFHKVAACGLCALYRFYHMGIGSYKIVGRSENPNGIMNDARIVRENLSIVASCKNEEEFLERMILPHDSLQACKLGLSCYYPEIRF